MKKTLILMVALVLVLSGCAAPVVTTTAATTSAATKYIPNVDGVAYKTGVKMLESADKFMVMSSDLQGKITSSNPSANIVELKALGMKLLNLYIDGFEIESKLLKAQLIIDSIDKDARVGAFTNLMQTYADSFAVQSEIDTLNISAGIPLNTAMRKTRNELAEYLGKDRLPIK